MPPGHVRSIVGDGVGNLWLDQDQSLFHVSGAAVVERIPWARLGRTEAPQAMLADPVKGGLWFGFRNSVAYFKDGEVRASYAHANGLGGGRVAGLHLDRDGALWAATEGGLSRVKDGRVATLTAARSEGTGRRRVSDARADYLKALRPALRPGTAAAPPCGSAP